MTTTNNLIDRVGGIDTAKSMLKRAKAKNLTKISYQIMVGNVQCTTGVFVNDLEEAIAQHDKTWVEKRFSIKKWYPIPEHHMCTDKHSTHARHLQRFGLLQIKQEPIVFYFEKMGIPQAILEEERRG